MFCKSGCSVFSVTTAIALVQYLFTAIVTTAIAQVQYLFNAIFNNDIEQDQYLLIL